MPRKHQSLNSFLVEEAVRDPAFGRQFERAKARVLKSRLGRRLSLRTDGRLAERIRKAAEKEHRSVSNWLENAARKALQQPRGARAASAG